MSVKGRKYRDTGTTEVPPALMTSSPRSRLRRHRERGSHAYEDALRLVDDLKLGHVGFIDQGQLHVIPLTLWRVDQHLYFHVLHKSRLQRLLEAGAEVCISLAECQAWVMAKSAYHHSANYRSAVLYCRGERVTEPQDFDTAFRAMIEQLESGRWEQVRAPNDRERKATALMRLTIVEGTSKSRSGGPREEPEDLALPVWHGTRPVCPFRAEPAEKTDSEPN